MERAGSMPCVTNIACEEPGDVDVGAWVELGEEDQAGRKEEQGKAQEIPRSLVDGSEEGLESPVEEEKVNLESGRRTAMGDMERLSRQRCYAR
jgi:hypothetical protein